MTAPESAAGQAEAIGAAAAAIEARLKLYGNDPASGSIGWGASPRELAQLAYEAIAPHVRAEAVAEELAKMDAQDDRLYRMGAGRPHKAGSDRHRARLAAGSAAAADVPMEAQDRMVSLAERAADVALGNPSRDSTAYQEWIAKPDSTERRAALGHRFEPHVPGYCTCGELVHEGTY